jgi:FHA domain
MLEGTSAAHPERCGRVQERFVGGTLWVSVLTVFRGPFFLLFFTGIEKPVSSIVWNMGMTSPTAVRAPAEGITERVDPISCLDERTLSQASAAGPAGPGRYIEVQGSDRTVLIPVKDEVIHIGRGLSADLHLDETSVSRRHAILVPRASGARVLDDRSSNGTFVNGRRVQQADLSNGDVIVVGRVVLRYLEL